MYDNPGGTALPAPRRQRPWIYSIFKSSIIIIDDKISIKKKTNK